jgi:hypothetical protein
MAQQIECRGSKRPSCPLGFWRHKITLYFRVYSMAHKDTNEQTQLNHNVLSEATYI